MTNKYDKLFLDICDKYAEMSYAKRKKVGAVIVRDNTIPKNEIIIFFFLIQVIKDCL